MVVHLILILFNALLYASTLSAMSLCPSVWFKLDGRTPTHIQNRYKIFSFGPNCSGDAVRLHYTGYYADRSYSVI